MLRTVRLLALLPRTLSAGFTGGISPDDAAQLRGGLLPTGCPLGDRTCAGMPDQAFLDTRSEC